MLKLLTFILGLIEAAHLNAQSGIAGKGKPASAYSTSKASSKLIVRDTSFTVYATYIKERKNRPYI